MDIYPPDTRPAMSSLTHTLHYAATPDPTHIYCIYNVFTGGKIVMWAGRVCLRRYQLSIWIFSAPGVFLANQYINVLQRYYEHG
ncbi:hypothetical protein F5Y18DRAFT_105059 [Xylariaceae sp. FL1019]|nr:hypothetical protein F5Y18DRAFT_105059 [Xylariaceae sp. FL1019]